MRAVVPSHTRAAVVLPDSAHPCYCELGHSLSPVPFHSIPPRPSASLLLHIPFVAHTCVQTHTRSPVVNFRPHHTHAHIHTRPLTLSSHPASPHIVSTFALHVCCSALPHPRLFRSRLCCLCSCLQLAGRVETPVVAQDEHRAHAKSTRPQRHSTSSVPSPFAILLLCCTSRTPCCALPVACSASQSVLG